MKKTIRTIRTIGILSAVGPAFITPLHAEPQKTSEQPSEKSSEAVSIRVMTYNIYRGGTQRGQALSQTAKVIQEAKADIVGLQEAGDNAEKLAQLLGWNHYGPILTCYEIVEEKRDGIKVKLPSGQQAYLFNLHLSSNPYQPYQLMGIQPKFKKHRNTPFIKTEAEAIEGAQKARGRDIARLLRLVRFLPDQETPVFIVGDFNEPSHLDWTEAAAKSGRHPIKVEYPNSLALTKAGFTDSYRSIYPDEMKNPGFTWSPIYKADDPKTHHDRIDFVYFKGKGVKVTDAKIIGEKKENADIVVAPYPSDHRAVVATFTLSNQKPLTRREDAQQSGLAVKPFAPGERVIFLGDSITHYGTWWPSVWCAYCARFPDNPPLFFNAGFSGDKAAGALSRLDRDVFAKEPDTVCVLFGMNDVIRNSYTVKNTARDLASQRRALETYRVSMDRLLKGIVAKGLRCIVLTPSPYDQTMVNPKATAVNPGCNDGLATATEIAKQLAQKYKCEVVDFHGPMTRLNAKAQASDPAATLVSLDRVHPGAEGSRMMAELFLSAQGIQPAGLERASRFTNVWEHVKVERHLRNIICLEDSVLKRNQINPEDLGAARTFLKEKYRLRGADSLRLDSYYKWAGKEEELLKILGNLEHRLSDGR